MEANKKVLSASTNHDPQFLANDFTEECDARNATCRLCYNNTNTRVQHQFLCSNMHASLCDHECASVCAHTCMHEHAHLQVLIARGCMHMPFLLIHAKSKQLAHFHVELNLYVS